MRRTLGIQLMAFLFSVSCAEHVSPDGDRATSRLAIAVSALELETVGDACYNLIARNGAGDVVWDQTGICADQFGDGVAALSYVGSCDASQPQHTVTLELVGLYLGDDGTDPIDTDAYVNPCPVGDGCTQPATCVDNADVPVTFTLTVMRRASQGFFDIAVNFSDLFCSAKFDCKRDVDGVETPLLLAFDPSTGERVDTAVLGLACTGGPDSDTHVYLQNPVLDCGSPVVIDLGGAEAGNLFTSSEPAPSPLVQVMTFRGVELLESGGASADKIYFNVAFGVDFERATGPCTLSTTATVSSGPLEDFTTPAYSAYPVIEYQIPFVGPDADDFACVRWPLDGPDNGPDAGVATVYLDANDPRTFDVVLFQEPDGVLGFDTRCVGGDCASPAGLPFAGFDWYLGAPGQNCSQACADQGLACVDLVAANYVEASCAPADSICANFFPDLPCAADGDGPRVSYDYTYTGTEFEFHDPIQCRYRNWNYPAMTCSYSAGATVAHFCACE